MGEKGTFFVFLRQNLLGCRIVGVTEPPERPNGLRGVRQTDAEGTSATLGADSDRKYIKIIILAVTYHTTPQVIHLFFMGLSANFFALSENKS
jgi:hypothetical protein